jgi:hypothetical protein
VSQRKPRIAGACWECSRAAEPGRTRCRPHLEAAAAYYHRKGRTTVAQRRGPGKRIRGPGFPAHLELGNAAWQALGR